MAVVLFFIKLIEEAGIVEQAAPRHIYKVTRSHAIYDGDRFVLILPYDGYSYDIHIY